MNQPRKVFITGKRTSVVTRVEILNNLKTGCIKDFFSNIADYIQGRNRQEVIDWENREVEIDTETPEQRAESWQCKSFDFLDHRLKKQDDMKANFWSKQ
ncbi:hypothetical protein PP742_gp43 [Alcaligenes phage vB_Af_QDWS595]|uniref:Uncharacterized protein n=1 Tax=Alcaligenes phage vB_Af_QDWS595 TaxID=2877946 RepID=A0AAE8Y1M3_9CAUD|nr:hypothetical protein PP742_gp43 [Alcaligenes phage vB_Af_QDWS595]UCR75527.1 hypothetical protein vBAfaPQDWS595_43 [Alcaligenes phage vB_Af_QDWS595]